MDAREQKGLEIAAKARIEQQGDRWYVPSQSGRIGSHGNRYEVTPDVSNPHCSCPDHETRNVKCKHIWAVEFVIQREFKFDEQTNTETVTETVTVKQTYSQEWTSYNQAQTCEKEKFVELLADLCKGVAEPPQKTGPALPLADGIFEARSRFTRACPVGASCLTFATRRARATCRWPRTTIRSRAISKTNRSRQCSRC